MGKYSHDFVEEYDGLMGFGMSREEDESTVICYLQMFSDDELMGLLRNRLSDGDLEKLFDSIGSLLKKYISEEEYHMYFLKDEDH
jgi:hypothetical protein